MKGKAYNEGEAMHTTTQIEPRGTRFRRAPIAIAGIVLGAALGGSIGATANGPGPDLDPVAELQSDLEAGQTAGPTAADGEPAVAPGSADLDKGEVEPDPDVAESSVDVALGTDRSKNGAVAAFASYSTWLVASPAAASDPAGALEVVGDGILNPATAQQLVDLDRNGDNDFAVTAGAYRVLAYSGDELTPDQVMLEIAAPLTIAGETRWAAVGGVVQWIDGSWKLQSIAPREIPQPAQASTIEDFTDTDRESTLQGLGWLTFAQID